MSNYFPLTEFFVGENIFYLNLSVQKNVYVLLYNRGNDIEWRVVYGIA